MRMPVTRIDKNSFIFSDHYTSKNELQESLQYKRNKGENSILTSQNNDSNLCHSNIIVSGIVTDVIQKTVDQEDKRKQLSSPNCEDSLFSSSPESELTSPVEYQVSRRNNKKIITKKTMSRKSKRIAKKFVDEDIANLLECDDDEDIFDGGKKTIEETEKKIPTIILRRSTEQSNFKIADIDSINRERRASLRPTTVCPARYRKENEKMTRTLPKRTVKSTSNHVNSERIDEISPQQTKASRYRGKKQNGIDESNLSKKLSEVSILKSIATTSGGKKQIRKTRPVTFDREKQDENISNDMNKENESDDSCQTDEDEILMKEDNDKSLCEDNLLSTPPKNDTHMQNMRTPMTKTRSRKISSIVNANEPHLYGTPKNLRLTGEPTTPKQKSTINRDQTLSIKIGTSTPSIKVGTLTPSMRSRKAVVEKRKTIFEMARARLHVSAVPKSLPCREKEFNDVFTFLEKKLVDNNGGCMYISGVPGTGKTATVNEAIRCLKKLVERNTIEDFHLIEINGMKLSEPRQAYVQILKQLTGETATWEVARVAIEKKLTNSKNSKSMTLLIIDELDVLCNKRQDVVYNLLDWPSQPAAKLVVVTIANTMDLPERVLMSRVTSRLGLTRLTFQPYNYKQLQEIVITRLNEFDAFKSEAVQLVARKVAAVSGDARRALDICRRATEIAEHDQSKIVTMDHVNEALTEMIANVKVRAVRSCSEFEKLFLQAICAEIRRTGVEETIFNDVYKQFQALCAFESEKPTNVTETLAIAARLGANRLILCNDPRKDILQKIFLNVSSDDIHFALNN